MKKSGMIKALSAAVVIAGTPAVSMAANLINNFGAEANLSGDHWVAVKGDWSKSYMNSGNARQGEFAFKGTIINDDGINKEAELVQVISLNSQNLSPTEIKQLENGDLTFYFQGWAQGWGASAIFQLEFLDQDKNSIALSARTPGVGGSAWLYRSLQANAPANAKYVKVRLIAEDIDIVDGVLMDNLSLTTTNNTNNSIIENGYASLPVSNGWTVTEGGFGQSNNEFYGKLDATRVSMHQMIDLTPYLDSIQRGEQVFTFRGSFKGGILDDMVGMKLEFVDADGNLIASNRYDSGWDSALIWEAKKAERTAPTNATAIKLTLYGKRGPSWMNSKYDGRWKKLELLTFTRKSTSDTKITKGVPPYQYSGHYELDHCQADAEGNHKASYTFTTRIGLGQIEVNHNDELDDAAASIFLNGSSVTIPFTVPLSCDANGDIQVNTEANDLRDKCEAHLEKHHSIVGTHALVIPAASRPYVCQGVQDIAEIFASNHIENHFPGALLAADLELHNTDDFFLNLLGYDGTVEDAWFLSGKPNATSMFTNVVDNGALDALAINLDLPMLLPPFSVVINGESLVDVGATGCFRAGMTSFKGKFNTQEGIDHLTGTTTMAMGGLCGTTINDEYVVAIEMDSVVKIPAVFEKDSSIGE